MGYHHNDLPEFHSSRWRKCFILTAAIFCNSMLEGLCQSFPEMYPIFLEEFKTTGSLKFVLIGSLLPGIYLIISPLYCFLLEKLDVLVITSMGSIISSIGLISSSFATHGNHLILCYTLLIGVGFGAIHFSCIITISETFKSYRGTAVAIILSVSGFSGFVISPCTRNLITWYGWRGANQIYGAILLNGIACGMIFNGISPRTATLTIVKSKFRRIYRRLKSKEKIQPSFIISQMTREREKVRESSTGSLDGYVITNDNVLVSGSQALCAQQYFTETIPLKSEADDIFIESNYKAGEISLNKNIKVISGNTVTPYHIAPTNSMTNLELRKFLAVLQQTSFILFSISFVIPFIASFLVVMNLPRHAFSTGLKSAQTTFLLTLLWVLSSGARIPIGFLSDQWKIFKFILYPSILLTCGILILTLPWISTYEHQLAVTIFTGILMASMVTLSPIFMLDMFGADLFPQSYSISSLFLGLSTMTAPLLSRWLPLQHSTSFIAAGIMITTAGFTSLPLKCLWSPQEQNSTQSELQSHRRQLDVIESQVNQYVDIGCPTKPDVLHSCILLDHH